MKQNKRGFYRWYFTLKFGICLWLAALVAVEQAKANCNVAVCAADYTDVFYIGVVESNVNVRVAAGQENDQVMHNGEKVQLKPGDEVTIIGEDMVGDKVWYKVRFTLDGEEIIGYCTSSYVKKTETTIMPTAEPEEQKPANIVTGDGRDATANAVDYVGVVYDGIVESDVNVRVAAGKENDLVMHNGEKVYLKSGDKVTIIGEDMVEDKIWYKVRFILDGEEIVGYCSGSYVTKAELAVTAMEEAEEQKSTGGILGFLKSKWPWIAGAVVFVIIIGGSSSASTGSGKSTSSGTSTSSSAGSSGGTGTSSSTSTNSNVSARTTICFDARHLSSSNTLTAYIDGKEVCSFDGGSLTRDIDVTPGSHVMTYTVYNDASENAYCLGPFEIYLEAGKEYDCCPGKSE